MLKLLISSVFLISVPAWGGGWTSGGGELIGDGHNPWFFSTPDQTPGIIRYCIEIDEETMGIDYDDANRHLKESFRFWRNQFAAAEPAKESQLQFFMAREFFAEERDCSSNPPLRFQFGPEFLTS